MKTTSLIATTFLLLLIGNLSYSQTTQDILDKANENKNERDRNSGEGVFRSSSSSSSSDDYDDDDENFAATLFLEGMYYLVKGVVVVQKLALESEIDNKRHRITSLELGGQYGGIPTNYQIGQAKLRGNWGIFSAEARYYHQTENRVGNTALYNTFDLQYLQLNVPAKEFNLRLGVGNLHEYATTSNYTELTAALDIYPSDRLRIGTEGRWARDADTDRQVRREWNVNAYYRLGKEYTRANFHAHINAMHARYYEAVDVWMISGGLSMRVE